MIIAKVDFPETYKDNKIKQNTYLHNIKSQSLYFLRLYQLGNNRNVQDLKRKIYNLEKYIYEEYDLDISIFNIIKFIINNLKYDIDRKYIVIDNEIKLKGVKILTLIKVIKYGTLKVKGIDLIQRCLKSAFDSIYINNFIVNFMF